MLKNYEVLNPFITATNDAFNRLKPGYEAPICIVTSIGHTKELPSRNRTVLICLIREETNPLSTRFELRSPNPKSNTYLVIATSCLAMLDGIEKALKAQKTPDELLESLSKQHGVEDFYLETEREYRSERNVFEEFTPAERDKYFGFAPRTVWENLEAFDKYPEKTKVILDDDVIPKIALESYKKAVLDQWSGELGHRIVNNNRKYIRNCTKLHDDHNAYDDEAFALVDKLRNYIAKDSNGTKSLLSRITAALDEKDYALASALQLEMQEKMATLTELYINYKRNIF